MRAFEQPQQMELPFGNEIDFARLQREQMLFGSPLRGLTLADKMIETSKRAQRVADEARAKGGRNFLPRKDKVGILVWRGAWALLLDTPPPLPKQGNDTLHRSITPQAETRSGGRTGRTGKQPPPFRGRTLKEWRGH